MKEKNWKSKIQDSPTYCYLCDKAGIYNDYGLQKHHIFFGPNRNNSEREGMYVALCIPHHGNGPKAVHNNHDEDLSLKQEAQAVYETEHSHEEFMAIFGKNYL